MAGKGRTGLRRLESLRLDFGGSARDEKLVLLERLGRQSLETADEVHRLHEMLCFMRAYPDDAVVLERTVELLAAFGRRRDLRRHRRELEDSGIANTAIHYRFFWPMARWLHARWPGRLHYDWTEPGELQRLAPLLPLFVSAAEVKDVKKGELGLKPTLDRLRGAGRADAAPDTDAGFVLRRLAALPGRQVAETLHDAIDAPYRLDPADARPSRTHAWYKVDTIAWQTGPLQRGRPDLRDALKRPPRRVRPVTGRAARELIDLAQEAMVTRSRDLEVFDFGNPHDVRLMEDDEGLAFAAIGFQPGHRLPLKAGYGLVSLKNGVPIGYVQADALLRHVELSYNTFETYRGGEAAHVFGRLLAAVHALTGATSFSIEPYQLGHHNAEGIASGAWWFYAKLGFRPLDPAMRRRAAWGRAALKRRPQYRSTPATLRALATKHVFFEGDSKRRPRDLTLSHLGRAATRLLSRRFGADRERAARELADEALERLGLRTWRSRTPLERLWVGRWAPYLALLPDLQDWDAAERRGVVDVVRAKAARRETDFLKRFDAHPRLGPALLAADRAAARRERPSAPRRRG